MSQFDKTTEAMRKAAKDSSEGFSAGAIAGRLSGKDSLKIMAEALHHAEMMYRAAIRFGELNRSDDQSRYMQDLKEGERLVLSAIEQVKARGDWPL